jgi:putative tricarboxylic transport membrane protein
VDCVIASAFGLLGLVIKRLNLPLVPIILGMVLGGIMEVKLRSSMVRVKTPLDFVERPIAAILALMILLVIAMHIRTLVKEHKTRLAEADIDHDLHDTQQR